jgi:hypothetical protein
MFMQHLLQQCNKTGVSLTVNACQLNALISQHFLTLRTFESRDVAPACGGNIVTLQVVAIVIHCSRVAPAVDQI